MKTLKKIKGFTLIEMLVTLSLSTLVVSFAYMAYNYIFSSYVQYEKMNAEVSEFTNCNRQFQKLVNNADQIEVKDRQVFFYLKNKETLKVQFNDNAIIFHTDLVAIDTTNCTVKSFKFFLGTEPVINGYIDKLTIETELNKIPYKLNFEKLYDAEKMIHLDSLNTFAK
ncbi:MAG: prepilin-type N-terminal cleavage/methylation domain-containing protein [Bacteroidota bacterium]|nr:prepilin-type N-terminal cleavage/methylation domain-containing protein [Bacteroidota bacterium]